MKKLSAVIFALGVLGPTAAHADSVYFGIDSGIANLSGDWEMQHVLLTFAGNISDSAFIGGVHAGYMHDFDQFALGVEGDLSFTNASQGFDGVEGIGVDLNSLGSLRVRAGWNIDKVMPYITAGVAFGNFEYTQLGTDYPGGKADSVTDSQVGFVGGGGVEVKFAEVWSGRAEVLYYDFGHSSGQFSGDFPYPYDVNTNTTVVRVGISREFGM